MQFENSQELPTNDSLRDDMLFKVMKSDPWYANIINFMVAGYVPLGENKRKLIYESHIHIWDEPYLFRCTQEVCTGRRRHQNHRTMSLITIWRALWCILHSLKDLAKWILLANHV